MAPVITIRSTFAGTVYCSPKYSIMRAALAAASADGEGSSVASAVAAGAAFAAAPLVAAWFADWLLFPFPPHAVSINANKTASPAIQNVLLIFF
ncbi:hypothetical protein D3C75_1125620 [compost metagenome]